MLGSYAHREEGGEAEGGGEEREGKLRGEEKRGTEGGGEGGETEGGRRGRLQKIIEGEFCLFTPQILSFYTSKL